MSGVLLLLLLWLWLLPAQAQQLAFPTAEGFGRFAQGGRGGKAYLINSLNSTSGTGGSCNAGGCSGGTITLRDCLEDRFGVGARTCIFRLGGIIDWPCTDFQCNNSSAWPDFLTIAGQTAPGDGIVIKRFELQIRDMHDVIVRHLRVYPGADTPLEFYDQHGAIDIYGPAQETYNIIIDHSTMVWAPDDSAATGGNVRNITWQWNVIGEGLGFSLNGGTYTDSAKCGIQSTSQTTGGISYLYNYLPNNWYRCPNAYSGYLQVVNNVNYNNNAAMQVLPRNPAVKVEYVNNYIRVGPNTQPGEARVQFLACGYPTADCTAAGNTLIRLSGNVHTNYRPSAASGAEDAMVFRSGSPALAWQTGSLGLGFPTLPSQMTAADAVTAVLANAGARVPTMDSVTQRQFTDWTNGTGRANILNEDVVGGYPTYTSGTPYLDADTDGMSDTWETAHGLNPANAADGPLIAANGYSNLENFLNELAGDTAPTVTNELVLHLPLDEGTGTNADDASTYDHDGTLTNGPTWTTGNVGTGAVLLDGTDDHIAVPDATQLDLASTFSLAGWVKPTSPLSSWRSLLVKNYVYYLYASAPAPCGGVLGGFQGSAGRTVCHSPPLVANVWTHLALTYDGATLRLYRNGEAVGTLSTTDAVSVSANPLHIGASQYGEYLPGSVDDLRVYDYALSALDVAALYALGTPAPASFATARFDTTRLGNVRVGVAAAPTCPGTYCEDFEGVDNPVGWPAETASINYDNTTSPLDDLEDLLLSPAAAASYDPDFNVAELWMTFRLKWEGSLEAATEDVVYFRDSATGPICTFRIRPVDSVWQCLANTGGSAVNSATGLLTGSGSTGVTLKLYCKRETGTSADGTLTAWRWDGSSWGSAMCTSTGGTESGTIDHVRWNNGADTENLHIDQVVISTSDIGDPAF